MSRNGNSREKLGEYVTLLRRGRKYYAEFMRGGRQVRRSLRTNYVEVARAQALDLDQELRKGTFQERQDTEVEALLDRYLMRCRTERRAPKTISRYRPIFRRFAAFCKERAVHRASQVDALLMEDYRAEQVEELASDDALYRESFYIKMVWKYAEEHGLVTVNRLKGMKLCKPIGKPQPCYSLNQVEQILSAARGQERDILAVLAFTGMRRAELKWLTWADVDLDGGWIHVRSKDGWRPKNKKDRKLPIHPRVRVVLARLPRKHRWVFTAGPSKDYPKGDHQVHVEHVRERLLKILESLGIEEGGLHSFRHFFISYCANQGVPPTVLMKWVGHSDLRMIIHYYELQDAESQKAMETLGAGENLGQFRTVLGQSGGAQKQPRPQVPVFQVVAGAG